MPRWARRVDRSGLARAGARVPPPHLKFRRIIPLHTQHPRPPLVSAGQFTSSPLSRLSPVDTPANMARGLGKAREYDYSNVGTAGR